MVAAKIVGFDPFADVALLKVEPDGLDLHPLQLGNDADLQVGQPVAAIGSPFGEQQSLSVGIVSATDRSVKSLTQFQIDGAIQTDASINPGNSGGPLLDAGARVLGINQQIETDSGSPTTASASPSRSRRSSARSPSCRKTATPNTPTSASPASRSTRSWRRSSGSTPSFGGLLAEVVPGGPADKAGLRGGDEKLRFQAGEYRTGGDVILQLDGHDVVQPDDLARLVASKQAGRNGDPDDPPRRREEAGRGHPRQRARIPAPAAERPLRRQAV